MVLQRSVNLDSGGCGKNDVARGEVSSSADRFMVTWFDEK